MKKKSVRILLPLFLFVMYLSTTSLEYGITGRAQSGCSCHGPQQNNTLLSFTGLPVSGYQNGITYNVTLTTTNTLLQGSPRAGFDMTASAGTFIAGTGSQLNGSLEIYHNAPRIATNGITTWNFQWKAPISGSATITFSVAGNRVNGNSIADTDGKDQWNKTTFTLNKIQALVVNATATPILCNGGSSTITAAAVGGAGSYQFKLDNGAFQPTGIFTNVLAGSHTVAVRDANLTIASNTLNITQPAAMQISTSATPSSCTAPTGSITVSVTGGSGNKVYKLNAGNFQISNSFSSLPVGIHTVTVRDANMCTQTKIQQVVSNNFTVTPTVFNPSCSGGQGVITVATVGGSGQKTYSLNNGSFGISNTFNFLSVGTYTLSAKDGNGCIAATTANVVSPTALLLATTHTPIACNGQTTTITMTASGGTPGYQFKLNNGLFQMGNQFHNVSAGNYTCTVRDSKNCTKTATLQITQPTSFSISPVTQPTFCGGANSTTLSLQTNGAVGSILYQLNNSPFQFNNSFVLTSPGTYTVTAKNSNNCTATTSVIIQNSNLIIANVTTHIACNPSDGSFSVHAQGGVPGYSYKLNNGSFTVDSVFTNLSGGTYTVTVQDANLCSTSSIVQLPTGTTPLLDISQQGIATCPNQTITLHATGNAGVPPYTYQLNNNGFTNSTDYSVSSGGTYTITVQDAQGCTSTGTSVVSMPAALVTSILNTPSSCNGTIQVSSTGGTGFLQHQVNGGGFMGSSNLPISTQVAATYTVVVKDQNNCTASTLVTAIDNNTIQFTATPSPPLCSNGSTGSIMVNAQGGVPPYQYQAQVSAFTTGFISSNIIPNLTSVVYTVTVKDASNCSRTGTALVPPVSPLFINAASGTISCTNGLTSITVTPNNANGLVQYAINGSPFQNSNQFTNIPAGSYTITAQDANTCTASKIHIVTAPSPLVINLNATPIACFGETSTLTASATGGIPPYQFKLNSGNFSSNTVFSNLPATNYVVSVQDSLGCLQSSSISITSPPPTIVSASNANGCENVPLVLMATPSGGAFSVSNPYLGPSTTYTYSIMDANGCLFTSAPATITVEVCD